MRGLCSAILTLEAIVLGLATPVMIAVENVDTALALVLGLGLGLLAILTAGALGQPGTYWVGHLIQVAAIGLGLWVPIMFFLGALFALLWVMAFLLGRRIEADKAARSA